MSRWVQATCQATAPAEATYAGLRVFIGNASYGNVHYVDNASLTQGATARPSTTTTKVPTTTVPPTTTTQPPATTTTIRTTTTVPPASTTSTTLPTAPAPSGSAPTPGSVGFRGTTAALRVIDGPATAPPGTVWNTQYNYLEVNADDIVLDGAHVKGGIDFYGRGTLAVRNSIVEGGWGTWFVILGRTGGSTMDVRDSTLRWRTGTTPDAGSGNGAIQISASIRVVALRNDISGTADGIQLAGDDSRVEQNWIHDLATVGTYPNSTHNDGIQIYDGDRIVIADNRIEIGFDGTHQNAAVFFQPGQGNSVPTPQIAGNYLQGGGYTLRLEGTTTGAVVNDNVFGPLNGGWGYAYASNGASWSQWNNNRQPDGNSVKGP